MVLIMIRFIEIKNEHIREGSPQDSECCAVALAMREEYKTNQVCVDACSILINNKSIQIDPNQKEFFANWINQYDECLHDEDGVFEEYSPEPFTLKVIEEVYENKSYK
ncbi:hypothetical protein [uncultured Mediterranean phage uvMED]|nr:hypothetical protein [uncultured Mediterranean phage uvMED]